MHDDNLKVSLLGFKDSMDILVFVLVYSYWFIAVQNFNFPFVILLLYKANVPHYHLALIFRHFEVLSEFMKLPFAFRASHFFIDVFDVVLDYCFFDKLARVYV